MKRYSYRNNIAVWPTVAKCCKSLKCHMGVEHHRGLPYIHSSARLAACMLGRTHRGFAGGRGCARSTDIALACSHVPRPISVHHEFSRHSVSAISEQDCQNIIKNNTERIRKQTHCIWLHIFITIKFLDLEVLPGRIFCICHGVPLPEIECCTVSLCYHESNSQYYKHCDEERTRTSNESFIMHHLSPYKRTV
jgi:hypothetical protein